MSKNGFFTLGLILGMFLMASITILAMEINDRAEAQDEVYIEQYLEDHQERSK